MSGESEKFALATHLYVRLRKQSGRVIDAVWMAHNEDYAREILRLARMGGEAETLTLVDRFEALLPSRGVTRKAPPPLRTPAPTLEEREASQNYIGALR